MRATIAVDGGRVTLLPRRAPLGHSAPLRGRTAVVVPLDRAGDTVAGTATVRAVLESLLPRGGSFAAAPATVGPDEALALAVFDLDEETAQVLGRALGLTSVLYWDGRRAHELSVVSHQ